MGGIEKKRGLRMDFWGVLLWVFRFVAVGVKGVYIEVGGFGFN